MNENGDSGYVYIHKHIDSLPMFCNWEIDVVAVFVLFFEAGVYLANTLLGTCLFIFVGCVAGWLYSKIKNNSIKGFFNQLIYMIGFRQPKVLIPSYKRRFLGA